MASNDKDKPAQSEFKLAPPGSKDYVAGQPADEAELKTVTEEDEKRKEAGRKLAEEAQKKAEAAQAAPPPPDPHASKK
ncbi:MAG TPA: hypothetical protein VGF39_16585 [Stellaceae bacterium]